jgi:hypothetical protein
MKTILSAVVLLAVLAVSSSAEVALHRPAKDHLLLLDRRVVASASGVELTVGRPERDARNPLLSSDQPCCGT